MLTFSILRKSFFPQEQYYTVEMIVDIITNYLIECGNFNVYFDSSIEEELKNLLNKEGLELSNLKGNTEMTSEDWVRNY